MWEIQRRKGIAVSEEQKKSPKRVGRPPKNPALGRRINAMFRLNEATRDRLMAAADQSGRSMSEEIERRIDRSFENVDLMMSYFGKPETFKLAHAISMLVRTVESRSGKDWTQDAETKFDLSGAISRFFHLYFYEQGENNSASYAVNALETLGRGHSAAEWVAETLGLKSEYRDAMLEFLASPEGMAAQERFAARSTKSTADNKKD